LRVLAREDDEGPLTRAFFIGVVKSGVTRLLLLAALSCAAIATAQEKISIPPRGLSSSPAPLVAHLFQPSGRPPHAAIVMVHGCGGAYSRNGKLNPRHQMWGEYLAAQGYIALMVDSFTSRGVKELCTQKLSDRTLRPAERAGDAYAALAYLRSREDVDAKDVSLLGWSHGGSTVLNTMARAPSTGPGFTRAIAFYPGCSALAKTPDRFHPYAPVLVLTGDADDWTPAAPCRELAAITAKRSEPLELVVYPGAYHDFDNPALNAKRLRKDVPNGVHPGEGVTVAPDPKAREDAKRRVSEFLLKP
jgi:dienelactone hydrolase